MDYEKIVSKYFNAYKEKNPNVDSSNIRKWTDLLIEVLTLINGETITQSIIDTKILPMLQDKPGKKPGSKNSASNIKNQLSVIRQFAAWQHQQQEGEKQLSLIPEETIAIQPENTESIIQTPRRGRPRSTENTEKISLYVTKDVINDLDKLSDYDEVKINTLLNTIINNYLAKRQGDIDFINEQAEARRLRKQQQDIMK